MYKPDSKGSRTDGGAGLSPEELEAAIALFKAQQAVNQAAGEGADGAGVENTQAEEAAGEKNPADQVRENITRRDTEGKDRTPEDIIAEQKADLDMLLAEIDRLQASSDMNDDEKPPVSDEGTAVSGEGAETKPGEDGQGEEDKAREKGVNMDSVDRIIQDRLDICRMADKLRLDGVEKLSVREGRMRVIKAVNPKINLDGKSDSYINAAYDIAKQAFEARVSTNDQRQKMVSDKIRQDAREESNSNSARRNMISRMTGGKK